MRTTIRIGLLILAAAAVVAVLWMTSSSPPAETAVGTPAPPTKGIDANGAAFTLADYKGKVVLLDFWGNW